MAVTRRPSTPRTPQSESRSRSREDDAIRRDDVEKDPPIPLVKLGATPAESWPPGTAWLKTLNE